MNTYTRTNKVDRRSRQSMIDFIKAQERRHFHGYGRHIARCVKIDAVISPRRIDRAYKLYSDAIACDFMHPVYRDIEAMMEEFHRQHGRPIMWAGRSSGWLILYVPTEDDFNHYCMSDLRWLTNLILAFNKTVDNIIALFDAAIDEYFPA